MQHPPRSTPFPYTTLFRSTIHQLGRVFSCDEIFVERRNIDQPGRVADRVVLVLVVHFVHADRLIARPFAVVQAVTQGKGPFVKCGSYGQGDFLRFSSGTTPDGDYMQSRGSRQTGQSEFPASWETNIPVIGRMARRLR